ncbi:hypothetical protein [Microbacterium proteolyticum]|uniref:hypothetical protein n=1 Tax=Microbacterium proteolyticum TaxID=1572644 RepID=UPI0035C00FAF
MSAPATSPSVWRRIVTWLDVRFRSPAAIYGLIVFTAFVTIAEDHAESIEDMLATSVASLIVFFIAHVFAHTLTEHSEHGFRAATRNALRHGAGMLYASVPSIIVLVVSDLTGATLADAVDNCLLTAFIVLAILGYHAFQSRRAPVLGRILGALATAMLGIFIVILEYGFH